MTNILRCVTLALACLGLVSAFDYVNPHAGVQRTEAAGHDGTAEVNSESSSFTHPADFHSDNSPGSIQAAEKDDSSPAPIRSWKSVSDFPTQIAVFDTVFWEPKDTTSLRQLIRDTSLVKGKTVLEIGTGSGLVALCCLQAGARKVVATDVNGMAIANTKYNARLLSLSDRLEVRLVSLADTGAYSVISNSEKFDLIISNPPWENEKPATIAEYALYDENFALLRSLLKGLQDHLKPNGKALLAYGCVDAIKAIKTLAERNELKVRILDDRELDSLPDVFLPGMLLEITPQRNKTAAK